MCPHSAVEKAPASAGVFLMLGADLSGMREWFGVLVLGMLVGVLLSALVLSWV